MDYWGGGGGAKGMLAPLSNYWGGGGPGPPSSYAYDLYNYVFKFQQTYVHRV